MNKSAINSDKLLVAITVFSIAVIVGYLILALVIRDQPLVFPWNEVSGVTL